MIISEYFGCEAACDDFALLVFTVFFFGDALALAGAGADDATGAAVVSVILMESSEENCWVNEENLLLKNGGRDKL